MNLTQFRIHIIVPTLRELGLWSPSAEELMVGTALVESKLHYLKQINGPALGVYQIETPTHDDLYENYLNSPRREDLKTKVLALRAPVPGAHEQLITNLAYATAIARLIYWRRPEKLPAPGDHEGLAAYWKQHYNTHLGKGRPKDFIVALEDVERSVEL